MLVRTHAALVAALLGAGLLLVPGAAAGQPLAPGCAGFTSPRAAQDALLTDITDPGNLDPERTGVACAGWDYTVTPPAGPAATLAGATGQTGSLRTGTEGAAGGLPPATSNAVRLATDTPSGEALDGSKETTQGDGSNALAGADPTVESVLAAVTALDCTDYPTQIDAIVADSAAPTLDDAARESIQGALNTKATELNFCVDVTDIVVPTEDDGSTAVIGGEQVSVIPDGSAETGRR